jgi:hypothetical protein
MVDSSLELNPLSGIDGRAAAPVARSRSFNYFKMEVRSGAQATLPTTSDRLPLPNSRASDAIY